MNNFIRYCNCLILAFSLSGILSSAHSAIGDITTVLGDGIAGFHNGYVLAELNNGYALGSSSLDGQETRLNKPSYVAMDANGRMCIADTLNHQIRRSISMIYPYAILDENSNLETLAGFYVKDLNTGQWSDVQSGFSGDGGDAAQAKLNAPLGIAFDSKNNLYIADSNNHRIRKMDTNHVIATVAGNGTAGQAGDGKNATEAQLNFPNGVAVDSSGNLYIADTGNHLIRKVDTSGKMTKIAGTGQAGFSGDGGRAMEAQLNTPKRVTVTREGIIYVVDKGNDRIRKIDTNGIITTIVGNGKGYGGDGGSATKALLNSPSDVAIDGRGNLFIADTENHRIRKVDAVTNVITTVAGTSRGYSGDMGPATAAQLNYPDSVAVDVYRYGDLYIADTENHRVRKVEGIGASDTHGGVLVAENLWIKAMIQDEGGSPRYLYGDNPPFETVWKQGGEAKTAQGDRVIWGYFYVSPTVVSWGQEQNPELFVKIWYDHTGRIDVNFFHVSVPDIDVYSAIGEIDQVSYSRSNPLKRYIKHTYQPEEKSVAIEIVESVDGGRGVSYSDKDINDNPTRTALPIDEFGLGSFIQTEEKGAINGIFKQGGTGKTAAGDEVAWGFIYANPSDVGWGSTDNPEVYVKMWKDHNGRIDINFFHVSVPDINVYSGRDHYERQGVITQSQRYTRHVYYPAWTTSTTPNP